MRWLIMAACFGCGGVSHMPDIADMTASDMAQTTTGTPPPKGFGAACTMSTDCRSFAEDRPPGFLGCYSFIGADYCSGACGQSANGALCWSGTTCTCLTHDNASGFSQTDCYCAQ